MAHDVYARCQVKVYASVCKEVPKAETAFNRLLVARLGMVWKGR